MEEDLTLGQKQENKPLGGRPFRGGIIYRSKMFNLGCLPVIEEIEHIPGSLSRPCSLTVHKA
jgi:hypothetical protein